MEGDRVSIEAVSVARSALLSRLSDRLDFTVEDRAAADPVLSIALPPAPIESVLATLLAQASYRLDYGPVGTRDGDDRIRARLERLALLGAEDALPGGAGPAPIRDSKSGEARGETRRIAPPGPVDEVARARALEARADRERARHAEALEALESPDARVRADAALALEVDDAGDRDRLAALLLEDPDAGVRQEAAFQLGFGPPEEVAPLLERALLDTDAGVVLMGVASIAFVESTSALPSLRALSAHADPLVREKASRAAAVLSAIADE
ncbi:MAG: HEAT repeat domain-containing protein [Myxococcota bacterium]